MDKFIINKDDWQHCETTAIGALLRHIDLDFKESTLFGLSEALSFGIVPWGVEGIPFIGGRPRPYDIVRGIEKNLNLTLVDERTTSVKKAFTNLKNRIDRGQPCGLQLDCYHLDYFENIKVHFAGHFATVYKLDDEFAYLIDSNRDKECKTTLKSLELARSDKQPMHGKQVSFHFEKPLGYNLDIKKVTIKAIKNNAYEFLNPPISNFGTKGYIRASKDFDKWMKKSPDLKGQLKELHMMIEIAGTGGAMFRNIYYEFLNDSYELLKIAEIKEAADLFYKSARLFNGLAQTVLEIETVNDKELIAKVKKYFFDIGELETKAMTILLDI